MRLRKPHRKQIKIKYETQSPIKPTLKNEIKKNSIKKRDKKQTT
jgi:hypothetical protein